MPHDEAALSHDASLIWLDPKHPEEGSPPNSSYPKSIWAIEGIADAARMSITGMIRPSTSITPRSLSGACGRGTISSAGITLSMADRESAKRWPASVRTTSWRRSAAAQDLVVNSLAREAAASYRDCAIVLGGPAALLPRASRPSAAIPAIPPLRGSGATVACWQPGHMLSIISYCIQ
jgi:hypothetical protein